MSENNMNEMFEVEFADASVITVPLDTTLSHSGEAAEAAAVGAALAQKADISQVTGISVNGESPDAQGAILLDASEIPMTEVGENIPSVADEIEALKAITAEDIPMGAEDSTTVAEAVGAIAAGQGWTFVTDQTGTTPVQVPADANEYLVIARYGTSGGMQPTAFQFVIPASAPNGLSYSNGYDTGTGTGFAQVTFVRNNDEFTIALAALYISGSAYTGTSKIYVWYR